MKDLTIGLKITIMPEEGGNKITGIIDYIDDRCDYVISNNQKVWFHASDEIKVRQNEKPT